MTIKFIGGFDHIGNDHRAKFASGSQYINEYHYRNIFAPAVLLNYNNMTYLSASGSALTAANIDNTNVVSPGFKKNDDGTSCMYYAARNPDTAVVLPPSSSIPSGGFALTQANLERVIPATAGSTGIIGFRALWKSSTPGTSGTSPVLYLNQKTAATGTVTSYIPWYSITRNIPVYIEILVKRLADATLEVTPYINKVKGGARIMMATLLTNTPQYTTTSGIVMFGSRLDSPMFGHEGVDELQISDVYTAINDAALTEEEEEKTGLIGPIRVLTVPNSTPNLTGDWFVTDSSGTNVRLEGEDPRAIIEAPMKLTDPVTLATDTKYLVSDTLSQPGVFGFESMPQLQGVEIVAAQSFFAAQQPMSQSSMLNYSLKSGDDIVIPETDVRVTMSTSNVTFINPPAITKKPDGTALDIDFITSLEYTLKGKKIEAEI